MSYNQIGMRVFENIYELPAWIAACIGQISVKLLKSPSKSFMSISVADILPKKRQENRVQPVELIAFYDQKAQTCWPYPR